MPNYLNKNDMMAEIHKSKLTYCSYTDPAYGRYDVIVRSLDEITPEFVEATIHALANTRIKKDRRIVTADELVFRVMCNEHVPDDPNRVRKARNIDRTTIARTPFRPFCHYIIRDGHLIEVLRSHWKGPIEGGEFCIDHGETTNRLAQMFMLLAERISRKGNFRGYSYLDEMVADALCQIVPNALMFDESKSDNPFGFFTTAITNSFRRRLNLEKQQHAIRDAVREEYGLKPSLGRQAGE